MEKEKSDESRQVIEVFDKILLIAVQRMLSIYMALVQADRVEQCNI